MFSLAVISALVATVSAPAEGAAFPLEVAELQGAGAGFSGAVGVEPLARGYQPAPSARIWVEEDLDLFYPGDRVNLNFRTSEDGHVAIVHVDTEGRLDLVYPTSRWDDDYVYGMRTYSLPLGGRATPFHVSRMPGIGYFYIIVSRHPLDLSFFFSPRTAHMGHFGHGRFVRGDPFWALDQLASLLVRDGLYGRYGTDVYSYHVGGVHRYPTFACYDRFAHQSFYQYPGYTSCFELQRLLTRHPHYFDTRRFRGDRTVFVRELDRLAPIHGFKEQPDLPSRGRRFAEPAPSDARGQGVLPIAPTRTQRDGATPAVPRDEPAVPSRQRPTLERRAEPRAEEPRTRVTEPQPREPVRATPQRESPPPSRDATPPPSRGTTGGATRAEPAREPARAEPRGGGTTPARTTPQRQEPSSSSSRGSGTTPTRAAPAPANRGGSAAPTRAAPSAAPTRSAPSSPARGRGG